MFRKNSLILILLFCFNAYSDDVGQMIMGQGDLAEFEKSLEKYEGESISLPEGQINSDAIEKSDYSAQSPNVPDSIPAFDLRDNLIDSGPGVLGMAENEPTIRSFTKDDVLSRITGKSKSIFSFSYVKDEYDYQDSGNIFTKTYEESPGSNRAGMLLLSLDQFIYKRKWIEFSWGLGAGLGYNSGKGQFIDGTTSEADFKLYTIPVDLALGLHFPLGQFAKLSARAGPSGMGLYQNRSDFEEGAKYKKRRQVGYGYFGEAKFQLSLTNLFESAAYKLFSDYEISQVYLDFKMRLQDYSGFQDDDISISGQSFGLGLSFEFL